MPDRLRDPETGLLNGAYFLAAVPSRVAVARRLLRPVTVVLLTVGDPEASVLRAVAASLRATLREADSACRLDEGGFGLILEDTAEDGAVWTIERARRSIDGHGDISVWAGVASYPAHGLDADELLARAEAALVQARAWGSNRIEIASTE